MIEVFTWQVRTYQSTRTLACAVVVQILERYDSATPQRARDWSAHARVLFVRFSQVGR
jgi:hypothetical protein